MGEVLLAKAVGALFWVFFLEVLIYRYHAICKQSSIECQIKRLKIKINIKNMFPIKCMVSSLLITPSF